MRSISPVGFALLFLLLIATQPAAARTWWIEPSGTGDAPTIQAGMDSAVAGDTVLLAPGTYHDCTHVDSEGLPSCVLIKEGVCLRSESGDPASVTIDAEQLGRCLYIEYGVPTIIEGITLTGGYATGQYGRSSGAGLLSVQSSVRVRDCWFIGNHADREGGGVALIFNSSSRFEGCRFLANETPGTGGGVYALASDSPFLRCEFEQNSAGRGGGLFCDDRTSMIVEECVFSENSAIQDGGGAFARVASPTFRACLFRANQAGSDGGAFHSNRPNYDEGTHTRFEECRIEANSAGGHGGGLSCDQGAYVFAVSSIVTGCTSTSDGGGFFCETSGYLYVDNCTAVGNGSSAGGGGLATGTSSTAIVTNTIFAFGLGGGAASCAGPGSSVSIDCSDVFGNVGGDWVGCIASQSGMDGNFTADPRFCGAPEGDFTLSAGSPCLDAPGCGLVGALGEGCPGETAVEKTSWGGIKKLFR